MNKTRKTKRTRQPKREWDPVIDQTLQECWDDFAADASSQWVPLGMALQKLSTLLLSIDWHLYAKPPVEGISERKARSMVRRAFKLMDGKFDIRYRKLPR